MKYMVNTEIGLYGIWEGGSVDFIKDKETYDKFLVDSKGLVSLINDNNVIIWGTGGDGTQVVEVISSSELDKYSEYIEMESKEYKLVVKDGSKMVIGSPEWMGVLEIDGLNDERFGLKVVDIKSGIYKVKIYLLAWDYDDESLQDLPNYVVACEKVDESFKPSSITEYEVLG